ncbi:MAG: hypothetical protein NT080_06965 [Spirochaetes bacterium]|nr:hypothetical protein [Spirochaetota bacterium]
MDFRDYVGELPRVDGIAVLGSSEARACLARGALLVDLREAYETNFRVFDEENIVYLPWTRFAWSRATLPRNQALILADAAGIYGRKAARMLRDEGYENLSYLAGGMLDWDRNGMPVRRDGAYELGGQCACKLKTRTGANPLIGKSMAPSSVPGTDAELKQD